MTRRNKGKTRIKWSLFAAFAGFSLVIAVFLLVLQVIFVPSFYKGIMRLRNLRTAKYIAEEIDMRDADTEERDVKLASYAAKGQACLLLYRVEGTKASFVCGMHENSYCALHTMSSETLTKLYAKAMRAGGHYQTEFSSPVAGTPPRLLTVYAGSNAAGENMVVLTDTAYALPDAVRSVSALQIGMATLFMLVLSLCISRMLARRVGGSIEALNRAAGHLADGGPLPERSALGYREISELADTLARTSDELSKVDRMQKELIANISHDLRTPLTMIVGYAEVMRDIPEENTPENMQALIDETMRLSSLVNDLLEISRIQSGNAIMRKSVFSLGDTVEKTVERYRRLKEYEGFSFAFRQEGNTTVEADESKLLQVVCNLLNNAIHYSGTARQIDVSCTGHDGSVRLEVRDYGIGISEEELPHIWQRYYRVDKVHRRTVSGSGLGLSIVREILDMHKARYGVLSRLGEGSTFWFELPFSTAQNQSEML